MTTITDANPEMASQQQHPRSAWMTGLRSIARVFSRSDTHVRSIAKAVSWRATGSLDTFLLGWLITGNPKVAGSIAATEIVTKILLYYAHERAWTLVGWGRK